MSVGLFQDTSGHMRNDQSDFIGSGSMDISKHFDMMESRGLGNARSVQKNYFEK